MADLNDNDKTEEKVKSTKKEEIKELSVEEKLKNTEDKLLRSLAELENQRNRFEKDIKEAIDNHFHYFKQVFRVRKGKYLRAVITFRSLDPGLIR